MTACLGVSCQACYQCRNNGDTRQKIQSLIETIATLLPRNSTHYCDSGCISLRIRPYVPWVYHKRAEPKVPPVCIKKVQLWTYSALNVVNTVSNCLSVAELNDLSSLPPRSKTRPTFRARAGAEKPMSETRSRTLVQWLKSLNFLIFWTPFEKERFSGNLGGLVGTVNQWNDLSRLLIYRENRISQINYRFWEC